MRAECTAGFMPRSWRRNLDDFKDGDDAVAHSCTPPRGTSAGVRVAYVPVVAAAGRGGSRGAGPVPAGSCSGPFAAVATRIPMRHMQPWKALVLASITAGCSSGAGVPVERLVAPEASIRAAQ